MTDFDLNNFDASNEPEPNSFDPVPPGTYTALVGSTEEKVSQTSGSRYLNVEFTIVEGEQKDRKIWNIFNLWNSNQTAAEIARKQFGQLCRAVNIPKPRSFDELQNKVVRIEVKNRTDKNGEVRNDIKTFAPVGQAAASATPSGGTQPWKQ